MPTAPIATYGMGMIVPLKSPDDSAVEVVNLATGTYAAGTLIGEVTATPGTYKAYATGNVDGSQNPTHILQYGCVVDGSGNVSFGTGGVTEWTQTSKGAPAYNSGEFDCADLVGLDAGAVTKLGRLVQGTTTAGHLLVYGA